MEIGLIDADLLGNGTRFPNLALMKISNYYKKRGGNTRLINYDEIEKADKVYISKVFDYTKLPIEPNNHTKIKTGGTGFNYDKQDFLPDKIEYTEPDYKLYRRHSEVSKYYKNHSIGFTTRFCFRHCPFCVNRDKDKAVRWKRVAEIDNKNNEYITLLDDNVLAHPDRIKILKNLKENGKPFEFKQGIDFRLINDEIAYLFNSSRYNGEFIFAFDNIKDKQKIKESLEVWRKYNTNKLRFYVLVAYDYDENYGDGFWLNNIVNTFKRIRFLMRNKSLPYIMRYKEYEKSKFRGMYINIAGWCNQPHLFTRMSFREYSMKKNPGGASQRYMENFEKEHPAIADEFFDMKWQHFKNEHP